MVRGPLLPSFPLSGHPCSDPKALRAVSPAFPAPPIPASSVAPGLDSSSWGCGTAESRGLAASLPCSNGVTIVYAGTHKTTRACGC